MRLILMFDLPMITKKDVRIYNRFHKYLVKNGYMMMQYSIYCKLFANRDSATKHIKILKRDVPKEGQIRIMLVTEKQYSSIEVIVGGISKQEKLTSTDEVVVL